MAFCRHPRASPRVSATPTQGLVAVLPDDPFPAIGLRGCIDQGKSFDVACDRAPGTNPTIAQPTGALECSIGSPADDDCNHRIDSRLDARPLEPEKITIDCHVLATHLLDVGEPESDRRGAADFETHPAKLRLSDQQECVPTQMRCGSEMLAKGPWVMSCAAKIKALEVSLFMSVTNVST